MNVYIWGRVDPVSTANHDSGAVVIVAESLPAARLAWGDSDDVAEIKGHYAYAGDDPVTALSGTPDHVLPTTSDEPLVLVFPDAGCC